jgi:hypothetical protein
VQESAARPAERPLAGEDELAFSSVGLCFPFPHRFFEINTAKLQRKISVQIREPATRNHRVCKESADFFL